MPQQRVHVSRADGLPIAVYRWDPSGEPRGVVQIAHGLAEHGPRYERLASALTAAGFVVYADDHRGHGASVSDDIPHGSFGPAGWDALVADLVAVAGEIRAAEPELPLYLIGHSMGSFASQQAMLDHSELWDGVVLSGSSAVDLLAAGLAAAPADAPAGLEAFNIGFEHRTGYEWLSRDEAEVDAYVADPFCGFDVAVDTIPQMLGGASRLADPVVLAGIRSDLPILLIAGDKDPVGGAGALVPIVAQRYRDAGIADVTLRLYPDARHEVFNETNRDEVTADVLGWLDAHV